MRAAVSATEFSHIGGEFAETRNFVGQQDRTFDVYAISSGRTVRRLPAQVRNPIASIG